jgi:8-oxo-dGTP pyrophosphatase MutT (NUDIX family)
MWGEQTTEIFMPDEVGQERGLRRGVVGVAARGGRLLVIRRSPWVEAPGAFCFPGGAIEAGEAEEDALRREFREELAAEVRPVRVLWRCVTSWNVDLTWWLVAVPENAALFPHEPEVESFHWLTPEEIHDLPQLLESNRQFLEVASTGVLAIEGVDFSGK